VDVPAVVDALQQLERERERADREDDIAILRREIQASQLKIANDIAAVQVVVDSAPWLQFCDQATKSLQEGAFETTRSNLRLDKMTNQFADLQEEVAALANQAETRQIKESELYNEVFRACSQQTFTTLKLGARIDEVADHVREHTKRFLEFTERIEATNSRVCQMQSNLDQEVRSVIKSRDGLELIAKDLRREQCGLSAECNKLYGQVMTFMSKSEASEAIVAAASNSSRCQESSLTAHVEMQRNLQLETAARARDIAQVSDRINSIVTGKDPQVETAFERLAAEIRASCMIAVREEISSVAGSNSHPGVELPRAGDQWIFTGNVSNIDVFSRSDGKQKIHGLACCAQQGKLRRIDIMATALSGQQFVHFKGTHNMNFMQGWAPMCDENGSWNMQRFDPAKLDRDTWL